MEMDMDMEMEMGMKMGWRLVWGMWRHTGDAWWQSEVQPTNSGAGLSDSKREQYR